MGGGGGRETTEGGEGKLVTARGASDRKRTRTERNESEMDTHTSSQSRRKKGHMTF